MIAGHTGWVRCVAVDSSNEWLVTSGQDRLIKFWDLASGKLKLSLTGHVRLRICLRNTITIAFNLLDIESDSDMS